LAVRNLPYDDLRRGSALSIPWPDQTFGIVFSHRVLKPGGRLVAMLYARASLNYQVSIRFVRRAAVLAAYPLRRAGFVPSSTVLRQHLDNAESIGLRRYLGLEAFTHRSTDGPLNPYARVYSSREIARDFPDFVVIDAYKRYMHAPPLPVHGLPGRGASGGTCGSRSRPGGP
jgi:hypothetical protein